MLYCITPRSRIDKGSPAGMTAATAGGQPITTGGSLRNLCPRHAEVINIEAEQDDPSPDVAWPIFSPSVDW